MTMEVVSTGDFDEFWVTSLKNPINARAYLIAGLEDPDDRVFTLAAADVSKATSGETFEIGKYTISKCKDGMIWLETETGEGMGILNDDFFALIDKYYKDNF
jgi:hypothetical protein